MNSRNHRTPAQLAGHTLTRCEQAVLAKLQLGVSGPDGERGVSLRSIFPGKDYRNSKSREIAWRLRSMRILDAAGIGMEGETVWRRKR